MLFNRDPFKSDVIEEIQPKLGRCEDKFKDMSQTQMEPKISTVFGLFTLYSCPT